MCLPPFSVTTSPALLQTENALESFFINIFVSWDHGISHKCSEELCKEKIVSQIHYFLLLLVNYFMFSKFLLRQERIAWWNTKWLKVKQGDFLRAFFAAKWTSII